MKSQIMIQKKTCQTWYETSGHAVNVVFKLICTLRSKLRYQNSTLITALSPIIADMKYNVFTECLKIVSKILIIQSTYY